MMTKTALEGYRFAGMHRSCVGAVKSCLQYYGTDDSSAWVYGITGGAFLMIVDEELSAPLVGDPEESMFALSQHLGLNIRGTNEAADSGPALEALQLEAWELARTALDRGVPAFAKELDLGNETSLIYGYDETGYYTHSWHSGPGLHEGADGVVPWTMLGRSYCPCAACRARAENGEKRKHVYRGLPEDGGFVSLHVAEQRERPDDRTAMAAALRFAAEWSRKGVYTWGGRTFYSGSAAYDRWLTAVRDGSIEAFYMGYFIDIMHESRRYAAQFLTEAAERLAEDAALARRLTAAAEHYKQVSGLYRTLEQMFPWMQPHEPIADAERRQQAIERLERIKPLDEEGWAMLEEISMFW
ncbi:hypothetical protein [Paenibacillus soyae]|uniref:Uncharacterized protein n=1 Tax=Paenibacillus soyae TaxID=2969249 RepID=A0A9X2MSR9_9BACL|nr:hypothetical protein [Paenibacillus soyae]MCR2805765.1 hypothetical protein [Paenibacillus soyae]